VEVEVHPPPRAAGESFLGPVRTDDPFAAAFVALTSYVSAPINGILAAVT